MSEMVDVVARAICKSKTCEGIACCQWPGNAGRTDCPVLRGGYDDAARAALEAVLKPTDEMVAAYMEAMRLTNRSNAMAHIKNVIQAALKAP